MTQHVRLRADYNNKEKQLQADTNGSLNVNVRGSDGTIFSPVSLYSDVVLQNAATETGDGTEVNIGAYNELIISVFGINVTTSTVVFEVNDADDNWTSVKGVKIGTDTTATSTSGIVTGANTPGEKWAIPVKGCTQVRARLSVITGTSAAVTVKGRLVL